MPSTLGPSGYNQSPRITQQFIDKVDDPAPGVLVSTSQISGSIVSSYGGQVGGKLTLSSASALALSAVPGTTTFRGGVYEYVQFKSTSTSANAVGQPVFWTDYTNYIVSPDGGTEPVTIRAGITVTL